MKRKCKNIDIADLSLIETAIYECLRPGKKRKRNDTVRLFSSLLDVSRNKAKFVLKNKTDDYYNAVHKQALIMRDKLSNKTLKVTAATKKQKIDPGSGKTRIITVLTIEHLMFDHLAVLALKELTRRIGYYQVSSIKGKGGIFGLKAIARWARSKRRIYFVKFDIKNFYGSVNQELLMKWIKGKIKNNNLLWLIKTQIAASETGLAIGSFLSQTLANLYLSDLYHATTSGTLKDGISHVLFYMDDLLFLSYNKRKLKKAAKNIYNFVKSNYALTAKRYNIKNMKKVKFIDMLGFRIGNDRITLRKHIYKKARRLLIRAYRCLESMSVTFRQRLASFNSFAVHSSLYNVKYAYKTCIQL